MRATRSASLNQCLAWLTSHSICTTIYICIFALEELDCPPGPGPGPAQFQFVCQHLWLVFTCTLALVLYVSSICFIYCMIFSFSYSFSWSFTCFCFFRECSFAPFLCFVHAPHVSILFIHLLIVALSVSSLLAMPNATPSHTINIAAKSAQV